MKALKYDYGQNLVFKEQQEKLIEENGESEASQIWMKPSEFVFEDSRIVVYLNTTNENEALIGHLMTKNILRPKI